MTTASRLESPDAALSLYHLLDPEVLANPYPLFHRLRREDPVHWDAFLHAWVVTRYADVVGVLHSFSADRTPGPEQLAQMGLSRLSPLAEVMVKQMLFMDAPAHTRLRGLACKAFTPAQVEKLKDHIRDIVNRLLDTVQAKGSMDVITDLAEPLPAIVTAEMLGVPVSDRHQLKKWSANFAEMLGNFQHNPDHAEIMLRTIEEMTGYFRYAIQDLKENPREGLIQSLLSAEVDGDRLTDEEVVANTIITMVGGQETTTNLIGNGVLTLLRHPEQMEKLNRDLSLIPSAVEEMLRFESPSQHTARLAPSDRELGGKLIRKRQAVVAVMAAANRDPERFPDPDRFDITRKDNRHVAFGSGAHFCFGAPLARVEAQIAFEALLSRFNNLQLEPQKLIWRTNLGLRGLTSLKVRFDTFASDITASTKPNEQKVLAPVAEPERTSAGQQRNPGSRMTPAERQCVLEEWNDTKAEYPADKCVHELVAERAAQAPELLAVVQGERKLTYRELNERANQLAHCLQRRHVGKDVPVAVCLRRSPEVLVALLAVLKAGGACLPLDPEYPKDRLAYMLEDSGAPVLVTQTGLLSNPESAVRETVVLTPDWQGLERERRENPTSTASPDSLAYVIYTSGSTGKPRGVLLEHRGLVNHNLAAIKLYGMQATDRTLQFSSISFDIAVEEIFPTWMAGGTVVLRDEQTPLAGFEFLQWAERQRITVLDLPTAYWHELVRELVESGASLPNTLRLLIVGGEKASASAYASWLQAGGDRVRWINTYGPTEASVIATAYEPNPLEPVPANLPIGRPIANTRVYVLDSQLEPVPIGQPGELHIGGHGVARGYLNQPERTAEKFIRDPFSSEPNARLYKTGDLSRHLPDGNIEFLGRTDFQVKIRGFRVELGEVQSVLEAHPGIAQATVIAREMDGVKRLAAYVIPAQSGATAAELRRFAKSRLPEYMIPADFIFMKSLPLTPNGKVDHRALPLPASDGLSQEPDFVAPRDQLETRMAGLWEQVLGMQSIGVRHNFFELGGHSLSAVRLMRRIEKEFGKKLLPTALIEAPTIERMVEMLGQDELSSSRSGIVPLQPLGSRPPFFFVHGLGAVVLRFRELARHMAPDQPFFGIQAQGLDGAQPCLERVEDMAISYLRQMRAAQPEGPYFLGGYSFGGLVALEMAQLLSAEGQQVALLALVDTYVVGQQSAPLWKRFLTLPAPQKITYIKERAKRYRKGIKRRIDALSFPQALKDARAACTRAERMYRPRVYEGQIVLFRASEKGLRGLDGETGWHKYAAGGLEIHEISADHGNILNEPRVQQLAAELRECLARMQAQSAEQATGEYSQFAVERS